MEVVKGIASNAMDWTLLIDEEALALLLPADYAYLALPIKESLTVFLSGLPAEAQQEIVADQSTLPPTASLSRRLGMLARRCPVLHKLGQVLARDQRLAPELRSELRHLESMPPRVGIDCIRTILAREIDGLEAQGIVLSPPPIAEASVAVVVPFVDRSGDRPREGVFKILKPGIEARLHTELELLGQVGSHLDSRLHELNIPRLEYRETFDQVRDKLRCELQLDEEQRHLTAAAKLYACEPTVHIPQLFPWCTPRITAMERIYGEKVPDHRFASSAERTKLAFSLARALIAGPVFSRELNALFHGDPHAGNLFYTGEGRLAILDWSLAGTLSASVRTTLMQAIQAALCLQTEKVTNLLASLDVREQCVLPALRASVSHSLQQLRWGYPPGLTWLTGLLDDAAQSARLSMGSDLLLFRKSLHMVSGVLSEIHPTDSILDLALMWEFVRAMVREWPARMLALPTSRAFATRLSTVDMVTAVTSLPWAVLRYWQEMFHDMLQVTWAACPQKV